MLYNYKGKIMKKQIQNNKNKKELQPLKINQQDYSEDDLKEILISVGFALLAFLSVVILILIKGPFE